jgi:hypothetical protein
MRTSCLPQFDSFTRYGIPFAYAQVMTLRCYSRARGWIVFRELGAFQKAVYYERQNVGVQLVINLKELRRN